MKSFLNRLPPALAILAVLALYASIILPPGSNSNLGLGQRQGDYYNLLQNGFLKGHVYMDLEPSELIKNSPDPYEPANRPEGTFAHDASYYKGHYYLYFGTAPLLTLMLPFRLVTGMDMPLPLAMLSFGSLGFLAASLLVLSIRKRYFPCVGPWAGACCILLLGTATYVPVLLARPAFWELPITTAFCYSMLTLLCLYQTLHASRRQLLWYAATGLFMGLTVASRFTYALVAPLAFIPLVYWWSRARKEVTEPTKTNGQLLRLALAVCIPLGTIATLMVWYNMARFGKPTEFGQSYQLTTLVNISKTRAFGLDFAAYNAYAYFLAPAAFTKLFPFINGGYNPVQIPKDYLGCELAFGVFPTLPALTFLFASPLLLLRRYKQEFTHLYPVLAVVVAFFLVMGTMMTAYQSAIARYMADFLPTMTILAVLGFLVLYRWIHESRAALLRLPLTLLFTVTCIASLGFTTLLAWESYGLHRLRTPSGYMNLAEFFNHFTLGFPAPGRLDGKTLILDLELPEQPLRAQEPILVVRESPAKALRLSINYLPQNRLTLECADENGRIRKSRPLEAQAQRSSQLMLAINKVAGVSYLQLAWNGTPVLSTPWTLSKDARHSLGFDPLGDQLSPYFSGKILSARPSELGIDPKYIGWSQHVSLLLCLPKKNSGAETLLASEKNASPGLLEIEYCDAKSARFLLTKQGTRLAQSAALPINDGANHLISLMRTGCLTEKPRTSLSLDGVELFSVENEGDSETQALRLTATGTESEFSGILCLKDASQPELLHGPALPRSVHLRVQLPQGQIGRREPLLVTGIPYQANLITVEYSVNGNLRFGYEHFGIDPQYGPEIEVNASETHEIEIQSPAFEGKGSPGTQAMGTLLVLLDGKEALRRQLPFYVAEPRTLAVGRNLIGSTTCAEEFSGRILSQHVDSH